MAFLRVPQDLFYTRNDPQDPRLGEYVREFDSMTDFSDAHVIAGYPDDEGIQNNRGRAGAKDAPDTIRKYLYRMTPHLLSTHNPVLTDIGNFQVEHNLDDRQLLCISEVRNYLAQGARWIGLGGGHDWGFVDGSAFAETYPEWPLVINFDAHLDVRPDTNGTNSGTPFYKLLTKYPNTEFYEIGIQAQCNSKQHLNWLRTKGAKVLHFEELLVSSQPWAEKILNFLDSVLHGRRKAYVSLDMDVFSSAYAPGCSQSFPSGLRPEDFFKVLEALKHRLDIRVFGVYEASPPLDFDNRTSKLAAQILHRLIY